MRVVDKTLNWYGDLTVGDLVKILSDLPQHAPVFFERREEGGMTKEATIRYSARNIDFEPENDPGFVLILGAGL